MENKEKRDKMEDYMILSKHLFMSLETIEKLDDYTINNLVNTIKAELVDDELTKWQKVIRNSEPKRRNRWLARFPEKLNIQEWWLSESSRPSVEFYNDGKVDYKPITIKFRDAIGPSSSQIINELMIGMTDHLSDIQDSHDTTKRIKDSFKKERENGFDYKLELIDPTGHVIEKWDIMGCKLLSIDYGPLSMSDDGLCEITMVLQPNKFILQY